MLRISKDHKEHSMAHDLVIRNGLIVDGQQTAAYDADLAIDGDTITAIGRVGGKGTREIDADGATVTPGFVDLHTHLDAQIGWDQSMTSACWHGVTTALIGNCGVTFAPVHDKDKEVLASMMESVEDIPRHAILSGLPWNWNTYGEYLDAIEQLNPAINVAGMVGHSAARYYVMGERSIEEQPTDEEIAQIAKVVGQSVKDGAIGFSTNRLFAHRMPDGRCIPGTYATHEEVVAISKAVGIHGGMLQSVIEGGERVHDELALMKKQLEAAQTRLLFSAPWTPGENGESVYQKAVEEMQSAGLNINGTTQPRAAGFLSGLQTNVLIAMRIEVPGWRELRSTDPEKRLDRIQDSAFRAQLVEEAQTMESPPGIGHTMASPRFMLPMDKTFWMGMGERPHYTGSQDESLAAMANAAGEHPAETWLRLMLESEGKGLFHIRFVNEDLAPLPGFMRKDWIVPGVGDAGAHVGVISDVGWTSFLLSYWHRDVGEFSIEEAVHLLTQKQAKVLGLEDRGVLAEGMKADINVLDVDRVEERQPVRVTDFPGGAPRLIQRGVGYRNTLVNGQVILEDDELTGNMGGRVLRNPAV